MMRLTAYACAAALLIAAGAPPALAQVAPAEIARSVDIPFEAFTLPNGLRVVVHTDRKAPVVAVHAWYNVGSKDDWETLAPRYEGLTPAQLDAEARQLLGQAAFTWVVVGDAATVKPQLEALGLPVEVRTAQ